MRSRRTQGVQIATGGMLFCHVHLPDGHLDSARGRCTADPQIEQLIADAGMRGLRLPYGRPDELGWFGAAMNFGPADRLVEQLVGEGGIGPATSMIHGDLEQEARIVENACAHLTSDRVLVVVGGDRSWTETRGRWQLDQPARQRDHAIMSPARALQCCSA